MRVAGTGRVTTIFAAAAPLGFTHHDVSGASTNVLGGQEFDPAISFSGGSPVVDTSARDREHGGG